MMSQSGKLPVTGGIIKDGGIDIVQVMEAIPSIEPELQAALMMLVSLRNFAEENKWDPAVSQGGGRNSRQDRGIAQDDQRRRRP